MSHRVTTATAGDTGDQCEAQDLARLLAVPVATPAAAARIDGIRIGRLVGFAENGAIPLVMYAGQPGTGALRARATFDIHSGHLDRDLALMFDDSDPSRPIVIGCLHEPGARVFSDSGDQVDVDADGQRLVVTAKNQIVLRCGKASITLTKEGKVIIQGAYVSSQSSGVMRIGGGSVQIN
jgi:Domain of unknown function (DUF6484)